MTKEAATTSICLCLLTGIMLTTIMSTAATPWTESLPYLQAIIAACCLLVAVARVAIGGELHITAADMAMAAWWLYVFVRTYVGTGEAPACHGLIAYTTLSLAYATIRLAPKPSGQWLSAEKMTSALLLATTAYELLLGMWQISNGTSHHSLFPVTGTMFNPGPYSAYVAMGMTLAIYILRHAHDTNQHSPARDIQLWLCGGVAILGCFVIAVAQSRSALIAVAVATAWMYRKEIKPKHAIAATGIAAAVGVAMFVLKMGSALGRVVVWRQALAMVADSPLLGSGVGSFAREYGRQLALFFAKGDNAALLAQYADVADYAFCDILQIAAEQGIAGCLLCLAFVTLAMRGLMHRSPLLASALATLLLFSLFSYPMQLLPLQTVAICLAAMGQTGERGLAINGKCAIVASMLCSAVAVCYHKVSLSRIEAQEEYANIKGMTHSTFIHDYYRLLPSCGDDKHFLFDFARLLQANGRHLDACAMLRQGTTVSGDPMFWVLMGNSLRDMHQYQQAAQCYDRAFAMLPNRLYPLYRKMTMLHDIGNDAEARATARHLLGAKEKVESGATREMRMKAKALLTTTNH